MKNIKYVCLILLTIFFPSIVSAGYAFDAYVDGNSDSFEINAEYGTSKQVELKVTNNNNGLNSLCSLECSYNLEGVSNYFGLLDDGGDISKKYSSIQFKGKGKEGAKDNFPISFSCRVSSVWPCSGEALTDKKITLTINYLLNQEQREAKIFMEGILATLNQDIKDADARIKIVENKLSGLSANVKVGSINSEVTSLRTSHNSIKKEVENLDRLVKQEFEYVLAKNTYRNSLEQEINSNGLEADSLDDDLEIIITLHNKINEKINLLGEKNALINSKLSLLDESNEFDMKINSLISDFESGNFQSYNQIESEIETYDLSIESLLTETETEIQGRKSRGEKVLTGEVSRPCNRYGLCLENKGSTNIEEICNSLRLIKKDVLSENEKRAVESKKNEIANQGFFKKIVSFFRNLFGETFVSKEEKTLDFSEDYREYVDSNCDFEVKDYGYSKISEINVYAGDIEGQGIKETKEASGQCCVGAECTSCCVEEFCKNDPSLYPIIFVHGHSATSWNSLDYSINAFKIFEGRLEDEDYLPMGVLLLDSSVSNVQEGSWGKIRKPISVRISYYLGVYDETGRTIGKEQDQPIDAYSQRLEDIVDLVLHHTGKDKVIIVAHSMGGLVSRNYIKNHNGEDKVYKLVTIGTPNHGIYGNVAEFCGTIITGNLGLQECRDMQHDSPFIENLNKGDETPGNLQYLTIAGNCDHNGEDYHDEVVMVGSVELEGATNKIINGECVSGIGTFHQELPGHLKAYQNTMTFINS